MRALSACVGVAATAEGLAHSSSAVASVAARARMLSIDKCWSCRLLMEDGSRQRDDNDKEDESRVR